MDQFHQTVAEYHLARRRRQDPCRRRKRRVRPSRCSGLNVAHEVLEALTRLSPLVATKRSHGHRVGQNKLVGATTLSHLRYQNAARRRSLSDSPGVSKYMSCTRWVKARYHSLMMSHVAASVHTGSAKRTSSGWGSITSADAMPSARRMMCDCRASRSPDNALLARRQLLRMHHPGDLRMQQRCGHPSGRRPC